MARSSVGETGHDQAPCRAAGCGQGPPPARGRSTVSKAPCTGGGWLRLARRGCSRSWARSLIAQRPQGAVASGHGRLQHGDRQQPRLPPIGATAPTARATAGEQGQSSPAQGRQRHSEEL
ncbi:hypothetical protein GW17_00047544 [Ensete ventricosum]|nr:hypothetical protein GW17_00047544 [Ensete ventricosum]